LTDTVNVNCCPDDVPPLDTVGGLTDSTIFWGRDNLLRLFLACFRFNWIFTLKKFAFKHNSCKIKQVKEKERHYQEKTAQKYW
jgi:hypothetical protein